MRVELWCTKDELDSLIAKTKVASRRQRLRVIRWALEGLTADEVATQTKLCRRQVQNWIRRFNGAGLAGLEDRPGRGRPCPLSSEQQVQFKIRLTVGPTAKDEVSTLRGEDVQRILEQEFGILRKLSSVYHLLHSLGYSSLAPRPRHPQADPERQELFKKVNYLTSSLPSAKRTRKSQSKSSSKTRRDSVSKARSHASGPNEVPVPPRCGKRSTTIFM